MISKEEFYKRCEEIIPEAAIQELQSIANKRKKSWIVALACACVGMILIAANLIREMGLSIASITLEDIFFLVFTSLTSSVPIILVCGIIWLFLFVKYGSQQQQFLKRYNDVIVKCLLQDYDYYYSHTEYIDEAVFRHSPFNRYDYNTYEGEDLLAIKIPDDNGEMTDTILQCSDLTVSYKVHENQKSDNDRTVYFGLMIMQWGWRELPLKIWNSMKGSKFIQTTMLKRWLF